MVCVEDLAWVGRVNDVVLRWDVVGVTGAWKMRFFEVEG